MDISKKLTLFKYKSTSNDKQYHNLGLIRIQSSSSAEHCVNLIEEYLKIFNLNIKDDIVAITIDGPNVMIKVGNLMPCFQQRCFAHGIQLAIIDVLYKDLAEEENHDQEELRRFQEIDNADQSELSEIDDNDDEGSFIVDCTSSSVKIASNYKDLITKARKNCEDFQKITYEK